MNYLKDLNKIFEKLILSTKSYVRISHLTNLI